jgi:flavin-dependent dehydrogenase
LGIEFVSPHHAHRVELEFAEAWDKSMPMAWQVRRSELDEVLFRNAERAGALTLEGCRVREIAFDADGADVDAVDAAGARRRWRARHVVDASGRDTLIGGKLGIKHRNPRHNSAAIFGHYRGARRLPGKAEGNISIFWFPHGWIWFIPLADGTTSIGAVCWPHYLKTRAKPLREFFADTIAMVPALAERLDGAELVEGTVWATGNYAYSCDRATGERWLMVGDAYAFIDPVFSSGVYLAMTSAFAAVDVIAATLDRPQEAAAARRRYERFIASGPRAFTWFIFRMTNPALRNLFMNPRNGLRIKEAVLGLLAGDIYGASPIRVPLAVFKAIYYADSLFSPRRTIAAWRARRRFIRDVGAVPGENVMSPR